MKKLLLALLFPLTAMAQSSDMRIVEGAQFPNAFVSKNYVKNSTCDKNVNDITVTGSMSKSASSSSPIKGSKSCALDASASSETATWSLFTSENELKGGNCEARFKYSGDASLYKAYVKFGSTQVTSDLQLSNVSSNVQPVSINFPCGDNSAALTFVLEATGNGAAISVDDVYVGLATNLSNIAQASVVGTADMVGATGCIFSENSSSGATNFADLGTGSGCNSMTVTGAVSQVASNDHRVTVTNMSPGEYLIVLAASLEYSGGLQNCYMRISDGTNTTDTMWQVVSGIGYNRGSYSYRIKYTTPGTRTFKVQMSDDGANSCRINANGPGADLAWRFYRFPADSEQAVKAQTLPAHYTGYHNGTWSRANTAYGDYTTASATLTQRQALNISCTGTGTVTPSITCTLPYTGLYRVCAITTVQATTNNGQTSLRLYNGTSALMETSVTNTSGTSSSTFSVPLCATDLVSSLSATWTVQSAISTGSTFITPVNANSSIEWSVQPILQYQPVPLLVGSVSSNSTSAERIERLDFFINSGTPTITSQSGSWVTSLTDNGVGDTTINMASNIFSAEPTCVCTTAGNICTQAGGATTTSWRVKTIDVSGTGIDRQVTVMCMGPR